jgi:hypothetical protein
LKSIYEKSRKEGEQFKSEAARLRDELGKKEAEFKSLQSEIAQL